MTERNVVTTDVNRLSLPTAILARLCRNPEAPDPLMEAVVYDLPEALNILQVPFPDIKTRISDKVVLDFGCGFGYQTIACALAGAKHVIGVESDPHRLAEAQQLGASIPSVKGKVSFLAEPPSALLADVILSQNAFEHFLEPERALEVMGEALAPNGRILIGFGPPWYAPTGAHMTYFCKIPWVHLIFSEHTIMQVRSLYRDDGYRTYAEAGLGELSIAKFEKVIAQSNMACDNLHYGCIKGLNFLGRTPLRELFINYVQCELRKTGE